ncbi:MAG TPA: HNH endonuclease signature motif containing protein [Acidimicrobiia bacterium]|nr:HNH endonuclease signature motif containing protein [Acidimicrobiia bacterium]
MFVLDRIAEGLAGVVAGLEPARLAGSDAFRLTAMAARIEKLAATAKAALASRADETQAGRGGRAASPEQWLAETSGCSEGVAREALATARRVQTLPATRERLLDGNLSIAQAALVSAGAAVDPTSERRGHTEPGETCEIPSVGPVPVSHAREVLSHGLLQLVVTDGVDVQTVVSSTPHVPMPLKIAIAERDQRCKVRGCDCATNLHRHHTEAFARTGRTTYHELGNVCSRHHHLVHDEGCEIVVADDGSWDLRVPEGRDGRAPPETAAA